MSVDARAAGDGQRVVLFDFDGVLVRGDTFGMFMRSRFHHAWVRQGLVLCASPILLAIAPFSWRRAAQLLVRIGLLGVGEARYRKLAGAFVDGMLHRPHQFHRDGVRALRQHLAAGDRVVIVTGCEDHLARAVLAGLGLDGVEVLASRLKAGWAGMRNDWHNVGARKVELLTEHSIRAWQVAYSDSFQDVPMLAGAAEAVLVNATPRLCKRVEKALGRPITRVEWY